MFQNDVYTSLCRHGKNENMTSTTACLSAQDIVQAIATPGVDKDRGRTRDRSEKRELWQKTATHLFLRENGVPQSALDLIVVVNTPQRLQHKRNP